MPSQTCFEAAFDSRSHYSDSAANNNFYHVGSLRNHRGDDQLVKSHYGSLRGSLLKSNQSLCSCNAETEVSLFMRFIFSFLFFFVLIKQRFWWWNEIIVFFFFVPEEKLFFFFPFLFAFVQ